MVSNVELQDTKVAWQLSEDKKHYTFEFNSNTTYTTTVTDVKGNVIPVLIEVTQIQEKGLVVKVEYQYDQEKNIVTAMIHANEKLKDTKPSWTLSEDGLTYSKIYVDNMKYTTSVEDIYGNQAEVIIDIHQIDKKAPIIKVEYQYQDNNTVTVIMHSDEPLKDTKPSWTLSEDRLKYSKIFVSSNEYATPVQDLCGNEVWVKIKIEMKTYHYTNVKGPNITVNYLYDANEIVTVKIVSDRPLQDTKSTWQLSSDKKTYTKTFTANNIYTTDVVDIEGNRVEVSIIVNFYKNTYKGIDVSEYQKMIDWQSVKNSGIDFAIIRAGYRGWGSAGTLVEDRYFATNIKEATKAGMDIGFYFFTQATNVEEARQEAHYTLNLLAKYNVPIKYPIAIDTERTPVGTGRADGISKQTRTDVVIAFCEVIRNAGYTPMVYANKNWLLEDLEVNRLNHYDIWLAHYTSVTDYKYPYSIWQYTSSGSVSGIVGNVDMNIGYKKF